MGGSRSPTAVPETLPDARTARKPAESRIGRRDFTPPVPEAFAMIDGWMVGVIRAKRIRCPRWACLEARRCVFASEPEHYRTRCTERTEGRVLAWVGLGDRVRRARSDRSRPGGSIGVGSPPQR